MPHERHLYGHWVRATLPLIVVIMMTLLCPLCAVGKWQDEHLNANDSIQFSRDVRPLLANRCFECHGPDAATREADLRLDTSEGIFGSETIPGVVVAGDSSTSELIARVTATEPFDRMPPFEHGDPLNADEIQILKRWIESGAPFETHWSWTRPIRPELPRVNRDDWTQNAIDHFILAKLEQHELSASPEANKQTLIRRLTFDLTGLPPTPDEVDAFLADHSEQAYARLVDRLLASPRYGERMAVDWLDAARYADTHGYLFDTERSMWRWRDWVIHALNEDMAFDQFTIEQLAGDLLPNPTSDQLIATGFNRNHIINNEAGANPAEYFVENVLDRVNTTSTIWMGMTAACAQCHDHKYDPMTQVEFYQLYAYFNNVPETGLDGFNANANPLYRAPTSSQLLQLDQLKHDLKVATDEFEELEKQFGPALREWESQFFTPIDPIEDGLIQHQSFDAGEYARTPDGQDATPVDEDTMDHPSRDRESTARVEQIQFQEGEPVFESGILGDAVFLNGQRFVEMANVGDFDSCDSFSLALWIYPTNVGGRRTMISRMEPEELGFRGYALQLVDGMVAMFLVNRFPSNLLQVQATKRLEAHRWYHIVVTYDGSSGVEGTKLYIDGEQQEIGITIDTLDGTIRTEKPFWIGNGHPLAKFIGRIDDARVFDRVLPPEQIVRLPGISIHTHLAVDPDQRTDEQVVRIRDYFLEHAAPPEWKQPFEVLGELEAQQDALERTIPTVMIMRELENERPTRLLMRGAFDQPGDLVSPGLPSFLPALDETLSDDRLGLAQWLMHSDHPLTARVTVNRQWQKFFGNGLVSTVEDFGTQGAWPTHPELLDWLAVEFVEREWSVKELHRLIVMSATYRQSSRVSDPLLDFDPDNRWLGRGPRTRLSAEMIRDMALSASGLLVEQTGGPSVKPYQPPDLWREVAFDVTGSVLTAQIYQQDQGESLYRRSLYSFWKRTAPPPTMMIFDAPNRERCVVSREHTSSPLQALVLMNDPTYIEAARHIAERMIRAKITRTDEPNAEDKIAYGFQLVLGRRPSESEIQTLVQLLDEQIERFKVDQSSADELLSVGESERDHDLAIHEVAGYTIVASVLLNLDEAITKE